MRTQRAIVAVVLALLSAGCQTPPDDAPRPAATTPRPSPGRDAVVRDFAGRWINWDWQSVPEQQRDLARLASPRLAHRLRATASSPRVVADLTRDRPGSRGHVVVLHMTSTRSGVVLTREVTLTNGHADLGGQHYRVYLVSTRRLHGKWEVSRWEPQP